MEGFLEKFEGFPVVNRDLLDLGRNTVSGFGV